MSLWVIRYGLLALNFIAVFVGYQDFRFGLEPDKTRSRAIAHPARSLFAVGREIAKQIVLLE